MLHKSLSKQHHNQARSQQAISLSMAAEADSTKLKEHLYRAEAERLLLQQRATALDDERQQLSADVDRLRHQLADAHSAFIGCQQQNQQLSASNATLLLQVEAAVREYRANDIIAVGLRDHITRLQRQLSDSQETCRQQASVIATSAEDMASLRHCKADLTQQLSGLQHQHQQLQEDNSHTLKQLAATQLELQDNKRRWVEEHGDIARQIQEVQENKQQLQEAMEELNKQLREQQQQLKKQQSRCSDFETEVTSVRDIVMVLGKAIGKQPKGQELPGHEDPVWAKLGPLGGVQYALEVVMKHCRAQESKLKGLKGEAERLEDRVRSESAQKAELQAGLYEVRGLYAKAIADRESLEARTARAEAEKAAAETNWQRAKAQAADDSARLSELQESVMSLTKQVQQLLPLQPRCSTLEVERDTAQHKLDRLQEQHDQLQRQLQQAVAREGELRTSLDTYKTEHMQLLTANAQLVEKCQTLNKRVQVLEISKHEGSLAVGQLEVTRQKLTNTQNQLDAVSDSHVRTLNRLETAKVLLQGGLSQGDGSTDTSALPSPGAGSPHSGTRSLSRSSPAWPASRKGSRHASGTGALPDSTPWPAGDQAAAAAAASAQRGVDQGSSSSRPGPSPEAESSSGSVGNASSTRGTGSRRVRVTLPHSSMDGSAELAAAAAAGAAGQRSASPLQDGEGSPLLTDDEISALPPEVAALLKQKGLEQQLNSKQKKWHDMKVSMLSWFTSQLRKKLQQETEHRTQLEVQLLQQEVQYLQQMQQQEEAACKQCMAAAAEAEEALQQLLINLRQAMSGIQVESSGGDDASGLGSSTGRDSSVNSSSTTTSSSGRGSSTAAGSATAAAADQQGCEGGQRSSWLTKAVGTMITNLQSVSAEAVARAELIAARGEVGVQSDEPLQSEWLHFIAAVPQGSVTHTLHHKAVAEAIVRIYVRALHQLEASWAHETQVRQGRGRPGSAGGSAGGADAGVWGSLSGTGGGCGPGGDASTLFDVMMAHYTQQQHHGQHSGVQAYNAALWKDPQGPILRLLVSCRPLKATSTKAALFCCFVGTHRPGRGGAWGLEHWRQFLLLLHATKRLIGGLWKGVLRDWSSAGGARLPLQCVHDLLGNVYNVSDLSELARLPALMNSKQLLLEPGLEQKQQLAVAAATAGVAASVAAAARIGGSSKPAAGGDGSSTSSSSNGPERGSVSAALSQLLVDGPVGPAVDMDDLMGMLMSQFDAGLLPAHPLQEPRRLTDGSLANLNNAWGSAAAEAGGSGSGSGSGGNRHRLGSPGLMPGSMGSNALDSSESGRSEWYLPSSVSGISSAGGWTSRPTTGAAGTSRAGTAAAAAPGAGLSGELSSTAAGLLPRIRTPDNNSTGTRPSSSAGPGIAAAAPGLPPSAHASSSGNLPAVASHNPRHSSGFSAAALDLGSINSSSSIAGHSSSPSGVLKGGGGSAGVNSPSGSRVAFKDMPGPTGTSSASGLRKSNSTTSKGRLGE